MPSVSFRELVQEVDSRCFKDFLAGNLHEVADSLAAKLIQQFVGTFDGLFRRSRQVDGTALGNESLEILV